MEIDLRPFLPPNGFLPSPMPVVQRPVAGRLAWSAETVVIFPQQTSSLAELGGVDQQVDVDRRLERGIAVGERSERQPFENQQRDTGGFESVLKSAAFLCREQIRGSNACSHLRQFFPAFGRQVRISQRVPCEAIDTVKPSKP